MKPENFNYLSALLKNESGLVLTEEKVYLVESRLMPVARRNGIDGLDALVETLISSDRTVALVTEVTDAMTTNESFFFRDSKPFEQFRELVLPQLLVNRAVTKSIRIWSAACSSGQEAYSLTMILREESAKLAGWRIEILATDISQEMLEKAKSGLYSQFEVQRGLPIQMLVKYFTKTGEKWRIDPSLREMVTFRPFNLLDDATPLGIFDVVFCRNVLIYFDQDTKSAVLNNIARLLPHDGFLYLGGAETVLGISDSFQPIPGQRGIYNPVDESTAARQAVS